MLGLCSKFCSNIVRYHAPLKQTIRASSQLYPISGSKLENALNRGENFIGDSRDYSDLNKWVSAEFHGIAKYLEKLVGTNHPIIETAKRCSYISEGKMGSAQARGLTVLLTSKLVETLPKESFCDSKLGFDRRDLVKDQTSLAEIAEITYSAYMIHRGVIDLKLHYPNEPIHDSVTIDRDAEKKGLHYGNKVSILCGDFLLAYVMRGLGDLFSSKVVYLIASAITNFMEGEFLLIDDWRSNNYLRSNKSRDLDRWLQRVQASIGSLQGNTCESALVLANTKKSLQRDAYEFGKNLGLAWQAHIELQPFLNSRYEPIELADLPPYPAFDLNSLPIVLFLRAASGEKNFNILIDEIKSFNIQHNSQHIHQEIVDYEKLHKIVLGRQQILDESLDIIRGYSHRAISHLRNFPKSEARDVLENICLSLNEH